MLPGFRVQLNSLADEYERLHELSVTLQQENSDLRERIGQKPIVIPLGESLSCVPGGKSRFVDLNENGAASHSSPLDSFELGSIEKNSLVECGSVHDEVPNELLFGEATERLNDYQNLHFAPALRTGSKDTNSSDRDFPDRRFCKQASTGSNSTVTTPRGDILDDAVPRVFHSESQDKYMDANTMYLPIFPKWFDPGFCNEEYEDHQAFDSVLSMGELDPNPHPACDCTAVQPVGRFRLSWDLMAFVCLLIELWVTPVELFFLGDLETPFGLTIIQHCITGFFTFDIGLNFMTGYIVGDRTIMDRKKIVKHYLRSWFWIDLIATVPFDVILMSVGGSMFSMARLGKASKVVKTLRYLKLLRAVRLVKLTAQANQLTQHFAFLDKVRALQLPVQCLMFLMLLAHLHCCAWQLAQRHTEPVDTVDTALNQYFHGFWWAYCAVAVGAIGSADDDKDINVGLGVVEMVISSERLLLIYFASAQVIYRSLTFLDDARKIQAHNQVLKYLRQHRVSFATQIQVLYSLRDTGQAKKHQMYAEELFANELPQELRRTICYELWGNRLLSLGLIREVACWHRDFINELCMDVCEEVFPSKAIVFRVGDAAASAYHIIRGELAVGYVVGMSQVGPFTRGMWVGESALASALLRRSATIITKTITSVMVLDGQRFQAIVSRLGLTSEYQSFCSEQLWKGLCGRCGALGDHFSDSCTQDKSRYNSLTSRVSQIGAGGMPWGAVGSITASGSAGPTNFATETNSWESGEVLDTLPDVNAEMQRFLIMNHLEVLVNVLRDQPDTVNTLDKLLALDMDVVQQKLLGLGFTMSKEQEFALTEDGVALFRQKSAARVSRTLFRRVSRLHHLIFLSHYKVEAGTEAALMRTELEQAIEKDPHSSGHFFDEPVFLDSDNLNDLEDLQLQVKHTHNLVLLLTKGVLTRPWVLVEIVTATREGVRVLLVNVTKAGCEFEFPDDDFYHAVETGTFLTTDQQDVILRCGITMDEVSESLRHIFQKIAVPYSPHKATSIRLAEVAALMKQCQLKDA